jgi:hypothetical protein
MLRQARKNCFDKSIQQSVEGLLAPDNADIVAGHAFKPSRNQGFGFGQLGSTGQLALDCRPDERARTGIAPRFDCLVDPNAIFLAQSDRDPGSTCRARILSHKAAPSPTKRIFETDSSPRNHASNICLTNRDFVRRLKIHTARRLRRKNRRDVARILYVPLPIATVSFVGSRNSGVAVHRRDAPYIVVNLRNILSQNPSAIPLVDCPGDSLSDDAFFYVGIGPADRASVFGVSADVSH